MYSIAFPLPGDLNAGWTEQDITHFLDSRSSEDKHFECKAFLHFDWELKCFGEENGDTNLINKPYHSAKPVCSYMAYRIIETIIAFANAEGGLLLLGVAETQQINDLPGIDAIPMVSRTGVFQFAVTGVEPDGVGLVHGRLDEDEYKRQLNEILFPKSKGGQNYIEKMVKTEKSGVKILKEKKFHADFPAVYKEDLVKSIKLIPFISQTGRPATVVALVISPSSVPIEITERWEDKYEVFKLPIRLAFNNNGPYTGKKAREHIRARMVKETNSALIEMMQALMERMPQAKIDLGHKSQLTSSSPLISQTLIDQVEAAYSTTPLLIAADLKAINHFGEVDPESAYFRANRILNTIVNSCGKVMDSKAIPSTVRDTAIEHLSTWPGLPGTIRDHMVRLSNDLSEHISQCSPSTRRRIGFEEHAARIEAIIRWFMSTIYPQILNDDYLVLFETENTELTLEEFNRKTIEFNHFFFSDGSTRPDDNEYLELNCKNPYLHLYAVTRHTYDIIGALEIYPLDDDFLADLMVSENLDDLLTMDSIPSNAIRSFDTPGAYKLFVDTVATHPQFRASFALVSRLLSRYFDTLLRLTDDGIFVTEIYAEAWTTAGEKMANYFLMKPIRSTKNGTLYKLDLTSDVQIESRLVPEKFQRLIAITRQLFATYSGAHL